MTLYHYTSIFHVPYILSQGLLRPTESNVSMTTGRAGPDVVWLTSDHSVEIDDDIIHGLSAPKTRIRISLDLPEGLAIKWSEWEWYHRMDPEWREILIEAGGGQECADTWYIVPAAIKRNRWVSVIDRITDTDLLTLDPKELIDG